MPHNALGVRAFFEINAPEEENLFLGLPHSLGVIP